MPFRHVTFALLISAGLWLGAAPARANGAGAPSLRLESDEAVTMLLLSDLVFGGMDSLFLALDRPLPVGLSILQISVGGLLVPLVVGASTDSAAVQIAASASGLWFSAHGIYNLATYPAYARERRRQRSLERMQDNCVTLRPLPDGAALVFAGRI